MKKSLLWGSLILLLVVFRIWFVNQIGFTDEEDLLVYRAISLVHFHTDEVGRNWPIIFGSNNGFQLPATSYLSALVSLLPGPSLVIKLILDNLIWVVMLVTALLLGYGGWFSFLLAASPVFYWPGNWEIKILTAMLLAIWKQVTKQKTNYYILATTLLLVYLTSFDAWIIVPIVLMIGSIVNRYNLGRRFKYIVFVGFIGLLMVPVFISLNPDLSRYFQTTYLGIFKDDGIINDINLFRGGDLRYLPNIFGKLLHNKLQFIPVYLSRSLQYISPSFLFAVGDKDLSSNSLWIAPFFGIYAILIFKALFKPVKGISYYLVWIGVVALLLGFKSLPVSENGVYLMAIPLIYIASSSLYPLSRVIRFGLGVIIGVNLLASGIFSANLISTYKESCPEVLFTKVAEVSKTYSDRVVYVSDKECSNPGPGVALTLNSKPEMTNGGSFPWIYIRKINNITVVSPTDASYIDTPSLEKSVNNHFDIKVSSDKLLQDE